MADILKPSELAGYVLDGEDPIESELSLNEILESEEAKEVEGDDVKVKSEDSSVKETIDRLTADMNEETEIEPPVINVNVDAPTNVTSTNSEKTEATDSIEKVSEKETVVEKAETSVTNNYITNVEKTDEPKTEDPVTSKPSDIAKTEAETPVKEKEDNEVKVVSESSPVPVEIIKDKEIEEKEDSPEKVDEITGDAVIRELTNMEKIIKDSTSILNQPTVIGPEKDDNEPIDVRVVSEPDSPVILSEILNSETIQPVDRVVPNQEVTPLTVNSVSPVTNVDASSILNTLLSDAIPEVEQPRVTSESVKETLNQLTETEKVTSENIEKFDTSLSTILVPTLTQLNEKLPDGMTKLSETISENTENLTTLSETIVKPSEIFKESKEIKTVEAVPRVETAKPELTPTLTQAILATPEEKKLDLVNQQLTNVKNALNEVNESQINNTNAINNISNTTNTVTNNEEQILTQNEPNASSEVQKEEVKPQNEPLTSLSEYYLQAIYDALVGSGIKIKGY